MSDLIVLGYDDPAVARQAYEQVQVLARDFIVSLGPFGGRLLKTSLTDAAEKELTESLS